MNNQEDNKLVAERRSKLATLRTKGNPFVNDFKPQNFAESILAEFDQFSKAELEEKSIEVSIAGRMILKRVMGKASFAHIQDSSGKIQLFVTRDELPEDFYNEQFKKWDIGDIIGTKGTLFKTQVGELSVRVSEIKLLTKSLRPLPDKFHGLSDQEIRYRQRYVDLIMNKSSRDTFNRLR
jgi:lysyl-tRNA synthetase class 2